MAVTPPAPTTAGEYAAHLYEEVVKPWEDEGTTPMGRAATALVGSIDFLWRQRADKQAMGYRLRYLYTKRDCYDFLLSHAAPEVDYNDADVKESLSQQSKQLADLKAGVDTEIQGAEAAQRAARGPQLGLMTKTAPIEPTRPWQPDPNARVYRGDPLDRGFGRHR